MKLYSTKQACEFLGITPKTLKKYITNEDLPIQGQLVNPRSRVFTQQELDRFKAFMTTPEYAELTKPGRKPDEPRTKIITTKDGKKKQVYLDYKGRRAKLERGEPLDE